MMTEEETGIARKSGQVMRFAEFRFHPESGELFRRGQPVPLGPKATVVLAMLLERPGRLVERRQLYDAVWPGTIVEFNQGLNACIRQIRRALGDDARVPRFIETVPRRGYRFINAVEPSVERWNRRVARREYKAMVPFSAIVGVLIGVVMLVGGWLLTRTPTHPILARVDFDVAESSELIGLDVEMEQHVWTEVHRLTPAGAVNGEPESYYLTGTLTENDDGAHLRAVLVRARDGSIVWSGSFNPLCQRSPTDPKPVIGAYLARVILQI